MPCGLGASGQLKHSTLLAEVDTTGVATVGEPANHLKPEVLATLTRAYGKP